ncbi:MAG: xanthine dehydrogenase accessory protein XdhC [Pseudomonadota bacterium]
MSRSWPEALVTLRQQGHAHVLVTVLATTGSTPRNSDAKMVVSQDESFDTIGGGQLEHLAVNKARALMQDNQSGQHIEHLPLAAAATQCCGGSVTVLFEVFAKATLRVALFGAGHVGVEVEKLLAGLNVPHDWLDSRSAQAEQNQGCTFVQDPAAWARSLTPEVHALVMTHDHQLDYELISTLLRQGFVSVGLIGSATKWQRFKARLLQDGFSDAELGRVRCPVGIADIERKEPLAVALSIVTELLQLEDSVANRGVTWRQVRSSLVQVGDDRGQ